MNKPTSLEPIYLVYGNHQSPVALEDYVEYLSAICDQYGYILLLTEDPVPGKFNFIIECFDPYFVRKLADFFNDSKSRAVLIVTEFITGKTFNEFGYATNEIIPHFQSEDTYYITQYSHLSYFRNRYYWLERTAQLFESIWCISHSQLPAYAERYGSKVKLMPLVSWHAFPRSGTHQNILKDIDFLFTGTMTPHRNAILSELRTLGYTVLAGPTSWTGSMRAHFMARSRVCLQIKQYPEWKFPSNMRLHYLLTSGAVIVAEEADEECIQDRFVHIAPTERFVRTCVDVVARPDLVDEGRKACQEYYEASAEGRDAVAALLHSCDEVQVTSELDLDRKEFCSRDHVAELDRACADHVDPLSLKLIQRYGSCNLVQYLGRYWALPLHYGEMNIAREADRTRPGVLSAASLEEVKRLCDETGMSGSAILVEGYGGYNLVQYLGRYWALPLHYGEMNIAREADRTRPGVLSAASLEEVKRLCDESGRFRRGLAVRAWRVLRREGVRSFARKALRKVSRNVGDLSGVAGGSR